MPKKKILVVSDSHGGDHNLEKAVTREKPDKIYHLGDGRGCEDYLEVIGNCPVEIIRGNCDYFSDLPGEVVLSIGNHVALLVHGHDHMVKWGNQELIRAARAKGADVVLYGHTHVPDLSWENGIRIMNPGSISEPRQKTRKKTYGLIWVKEDGELEFEIKEL